MRAFVFEEGKKGGKNKADFIDNYNFIILFDVLDARDMHRQERARCPSMRALCIRMQHS